MNRPLLYLVGDGDVRTLKFTPTLQFIEVINITTVDGKRRLKELAKMSIEEVLELMYACEGERAYKYLTGKLVLLDADTKFRDGAWIPQTERIVKFTRYEDEGELITMFRGIIEEHRKPKHKPKPVPKKKVEHTNVIVSKPVPKKKDVVAAAEKKLTSLERMMQRVKEMGLV